MKSEIEIKQVEVSSGNSVRTLQIVEISKSERLQSRVKQDSAVTTRYAEDMMRGVKFPPVIVFHDGKNKWLADGNYRVAAAVQAGLTEIEAEVREGSERDAMFYALGANVANGSPLTRDDKRQAVTKFVMDNEWNKWSDGSIAKHCGVSDNFVGQMRKRLNIQRSESVVCLRHGKQIEMRTAKIGMAKSNKRASAPKLLLPAPVNATSGAVQGEVDSRFEEAQIVAPIHVATVDSHNADVVGKVTFDMSAANESKSSETFSGERSFQYVLQAGSDEEAAAKVQSFANAIEKMAGDYGMIIEFKRESVLRDSTLFVRSGHAEAIMS